MGRLFFHLILLSFFVLNLASHDEFLDVDLDTTTEKKYNVDFPTKFPSNKTSRRDHKFSRINLLRDETLNEKLRKDEKETSTTMKAVDLMTTRKKSTTTNPSVPLDPEPITTMKVRTHEDAPIPENNITHTPRWFIAGAFLGVVAAFLSMYVYKFFKNRGESSYQNL